MITRSNVLFAACRTAMLAELQADIQTNLIPQFNSEIEDIRRQGAETEEFAADQPELAKAALLNLVRARRSARLLELTNKRRQFLDGIKLRLKLEMSEKASELSGTITTHTDDRNRTVEVVQFPDGSSTKMPNNVYVDFSQFDRL